MTYILKRTFSILNYTIGNFNRETKGKQHTCFSDFSLKTAFVNQRVSDEKKNSIIFASKSLSRISSLFDNVLQYIIELSAIHTHTHSVAKKIKPNNSKSLYSCCLLVANRNKRFLLRYTILFTFYLLYKCLYIVYATNKYNSMFILKIHVTLRIKHAFSQ